MSSRTSVFALKGKPGDVRAIGALLGASWVLEGTVRRAGAKLRITAQLTSTDDGRLLWSERFDRTLDDVFAIQEEIARTIVDTLRATTFVTFVTSVMGRAAARPASTHIVSTSRGRYAWNKRSQAGINEAIDTSRRRSARTRRTPRPTPVSPIRTRCRSTTANVPVAEGFARAEEYARKALALDDTVAETHASLAWSIFIYGWKWEEAQAEFRRAIALDPAYATARQWYAFWFSAMASTTRRWRKSTGPRSSTRRRSRSGAAWAGSTTMPGATTGTLSSRARGHHESPVG